MISIEEELKAAFPAGCSFEVYHLQSPSRQINGFRTYKNSKDNIVIKTSHFLSVSYNQKIFFAIDIPIYFEVKENELIRTLFISKADTNGFLEYKSLKLSLIIETFIKYLLKISPAHYLERIIPLERSFDLKDKSVIINRKTKTTQGLKIMSERARLREKVHSNFLHKKLYLRVPTENLKTLKTQISLFTKPEPHYLFTGSGENPNKHFLTGEKLLKWWLKIIDNVKKNETIFVQDNEMHATLQIPGEDTNFIKRRYLTHLSSNWETGTIFGSENSSIENIPIFHDDPKTRFIKDLINDDKHRKMTLKKFWKEMEGRQEFRSGIVVSVIGVSGTTLFNNLTRPNKERCTLKAVSKFKYKQYKSYVVGEEYNTMEAAMDARDNLYQIWKRNDPKFSEITGERHIESKQTTLNVNTINTISYRRK